MTDAERQFPRGSCDTHIHVYDDSFPVAATTVLRPPQASRDQYATLQRQLGLDRAVVVQPTTYGLDNRLQLEAVEALGDNARAVVVVDDHTSLPELERLTAAGARGARFHMLPGGAVGWDALGPVAERVADLGWHIQLQLNGRELAARAADLAKLPCPLVIDHIGRFMPPVSETDPSFLALLALIDEGSCWVKLSAPYESLVTDESRHDHVTLLARRLVDHAPERLLWASNWPHPGRSVPPDAAELRRWLFDWVGDPATRTQVLVDNPATLYDFAEESLR